MSVEIRATPDHAVYVDGRTIDPGTAAHRAGILFCGILTTRKQGQTMIDVGCFLRLERPLVLPLEEAAGVALTLFGAAVNAVDLGEADCSPEAVVAAATSGGRSLRETPFHRHELGGDGGGA